MPIVTTSFDFSHSPAVSFFTLSFSLLPLHSHAISVFTQILSLAVLSLPSPQRASLLSRCRRRLPLFMLISFHQFLLLKSSLARFPLLNDGKILSFTLSVHSLLSLSLSAAATA
ncbi:hypothetical protein CIPAW_06G062500 [Carya illinoinensis]|uniref:Uncharacterized protein n=1 Tax=Carya illinoinensis TaxID=32201 RepID=A0A8T1Q8G0_CARIL|nr:hypothetical protein CIPAW_06G062500 [Carya illinoinensis]KAG6708087.1 hypothetical protein I3842_06G062400 [Carya illinoinensis]KAG6708088.1 hypothetical protein I3842_06G062400 [Carya illinoinensis]KAG6708089.1 hypothetical protein I3842_06G062400 [Carya illinoinensis]